MKLSDIATPVSSLAGVGPATARQLANLAVYTIGDLLSYYPRDWEDRTRRIALSEYKSGRVHTFAQVIAHEWFGFGRMRTLKICIFDGSAQGELIAFNRPFLEKSLTIGSIISVTGSFAVKYGKLQCSSFEASVIARPGQNDAPFPALSDFTGRPLPDAAVYPVYSLTAGLSQQQLRKIMQRAVREYCRGIDDEIPPGIIRARQLLTKQDAVRAMHMPVSLEEALNARRSLIYEELYRFQYGVACRALQHKGRLPSDGDCDLLSAVQSVSAESSAPAVETEFFQSLSPRQKQLITALPFSLTDGQRRVISEMNTDIDRGYKSRAAVLAGMDEMQTDTPIPDTAVYTMARLLQGDVGSGKTLAAFFACLRVIDWGGQCALLAPTELLARQHGDTAARLLSPCGVSLAFLTGNVKAEGRGPLLQGLKEGTIDLVIGTHALFSKNVQYKDLQLAVIDEQHRFGVLQRNAIIEKGRKPFAPHLLMMSATPIPRTLALTVFGDLDVSIIRTMPCGRKPIKTYLTRMGNESRVYDFVAKEVSCGHQAYFVYPRIEETEDDETETGKRKNTLKTAERMYEFLSEKVFPQFKLGLVHSRVDESEQHRILDAFRQGTIQILIATSVVEVGVDVPNATCMVIEHADRFGLAALHQLRGRVGRGNIQSYCFPIYSAAISETGKERMRALYETSDGFEIAEKDLQLRGAGEVNGIQQSGYFTIGLADPIRDQELLMLARQDAFAQAAIAEKR